MQSCRSSAVAFSPQSKFTTDSASKPFQIVSNLSHELRTPLHVLNGYLEILSEDWGAEFSGEPRRMLERLRSSASELTQTLENLLEYTANAAGTQPAVEESVDLAELIGELKPVFAACAKRRKLSLVWRVEPSLKLQSDRRRLLSLVSNLVSNAIKFTQRGGVTVSLRRVRINHRWTVEIKVVDTGIGMEPRQVETAFAPFVQLSNSNSREHRGLGLGLALVRRNAKALGATVEVTSKPGAGSRFTVRLAQSQR